VGPRLSPTRFSLTGAESGWKPSRTDRAPRRQAKNALHYADLLIMPTSAAKPAWEAVIAVKEAA
jgi:hypothetical protein